MSEEIKSLIAKLRAEVDKKHRAQHQSLDELAAELLGKAAAPPLDEPPPKTPAAPGAATLANESTVQKVLAAIDGEYKSVSTISKETGIEETKVRGALYSKFVQSRIKKHTREGVMKFKAKAAGGAKKTTEPPDHGGPTMAARVRAALESHPHGLTAMQLNSTLGAETLREKKTISASLYNLKMEKKATHDKKTRIYRLITESSTTNGQG